MVSVRRSLVLGPVLLALAAGPGPVTDTPPVAAGAAATRTAEPDGPAHPGYVSPLGGTPVVLTPFRPPTERYGRGHRGVDLAASPGEAVRAAGPGTVVYAGTLAGRGVVSIQHASGLRTTYEPVAASVAAGDVVTAGTRIGTVSAGHASCAPRSCLHWGARIGPETYIDPMLLIGRVRIRLEPWS